METQQYITRFVQLYRSLQWLNNSFDDIMTFPVISFFPARMFDNSIVNILAIYWHFIWTCFTCTHLGENSVKIIATNQTEDRKFHRPFVPIINIYQIALAFFFLLIFFSPFWGRGGRSKSGNTYEDLKLRND